MKNKHTVYELQCYCPPTKNFEPLLGCDYDTREEGLAVFNRMLKEGRALGVRLVEIKPGAVRKVKRVVVVGPLPQCYFDDELEAREMGL